MKLVPPEEMLPVQTPRPALNTVVIIQDPERPTDEWPFFLRLRLEAYDLAVALNDLPAKAMTGQLVVRDNGTVTVYPVQLEPDDGPLTVWHVFYTGQPVSQDVRHERRNTDITLSGLIYRDGADRESRVPTISYDFSPSAIRLFVPWRLDAGDRVHTHWAIDNGTVDGWMTILRRDPMVVWWNKQQGYQAVGRWTHVEDTDARRWQAFCWQHQPNQ